MKKIIKILGFVLSLILCFSCFACLKPGLSAYEIAVQNGFVGTEQEWLESLKGEDGTNGKSAYEIAIESGLFQGSQEEWIDSLKGEDGRNGVDGKDVFEVWYNAVKEEGYTGNYSDFLLEYIKGNILATQNTDTVNANNTLLSSVEVYAKSSKKGEEKVFSGGGTVVKDDKENGDAYIITNYHVVYDPTSATTLSEECYVMFYGMMFLNTPPESRLLDVLRLNAVRCKVVGGSFENDIAVLKVENSYIYRNGPYKPALIGNSDKVIVGDNTIVVGNPQSEGLSITKGTISVDSEEIDIKGSDDVTDINLRVIRTDADINHGNSGGGLFNSKGEFIGVISVKNFASDVDGFGYAIPSNVAMGIANNVINRYEDSATIYEDEVETNGYGFMKCTLGIQVVVDYSWADYDEVEGVVRIKQSIVVLEVLEGSAKNYVKEGDEIISASLNGIQVGVDRIFTIGDLLLNAKKGDILTMKVVRYLNDEPTEITLEIPLINSTYVR